MDERLDLKTIIRHWEWCRFAYNAVLAIEGLLLTGDLVAYVGWPVYLAGALYVGLVANAFFGLGPLFEFYLYAYGIPIGKGRYAVFAFGLLFSMATILVMSIVAAIQLDPSRM